MAATHSNTFRRVFPFGELLRGSARSAALWSTSASLVLGLLLFDAFLVIDLLLKPDRLLNPDPGAPTEGFWVTGLAAEVRQLPGMRAPANALAVLILCGIVLGVLRGLMLGRARTLSLRVGMEIVTGLRRSIHRQRLRLGPGDLENKTSGFVFNLFTTESDRVRDGVAVWVYRAGRYPFELALLATVAVSLHWLAALQSIVPLAVCWALAHRERRRSERARKLAEDRSRNEINLLAESLKKTRLVRGYGMETFEHDQFQRHLDQFRSDVSSLKQGQGWSRLATGMLVILGVTIVLYLVGLKVLQDPGSREYLPFSAAVVMLAAFSLMHWPLEQLWKLPSETTAAAVAADQIYRYINEIPEVGQAVGAKFLQPLSKSLRFEAVTYTLPSGRNLLDGFDLKLPAGGITSFISLDPLEAQALMYLLPRFIEPQSGHVLFDGEDIAWVTLESLRAEAIYVGGADPCFTGTVLENISCGNPEYNLQDVTEAAKLTHAHNFILRLPQGYETVLGEHGEQLDPGQSIRLGLARAILREPALLIIDEPEADLDTDTKTMLDDAYNRIARNRTVFFLPSRLSTVRRSDQIVLIHKGRPASVGAHSQLVKNAPLYRHWEYIQFNEFRHLLGSEE